MNSFWVGLRYLLAIYLFCLGCYLLVDLIFTGFNLGILLGAIVSFLLCYLIKPKREKKDEDPQHDIYDLLDIITEFPYRIISSFLRNLWRAIERLKDRDGIDFDD